jgi:pyruvate,water dikinase
LIEIAHELRGRTAARKLRTLVSRRLSAENLAPMMQPVSGMTNARLIIPFRDIDLASLAEVGGKNASLGELLRGLAPTAVRIPDGFAITAEAFRAHLAQDGTDQAIYDEFERVDVRDVAALARAGAFARERVRALPLPRALQIEISAAYDQLSHACHDKATDVAVRSSAAARRTVA